MQKLAHAREVPTNVEVHIESEPEQVASASSQEIRVLPSPIAYGELQSTVGPDAKQVVPYLLGLTQIMGTSLAGGGKDGLGNLLTYLRDTVREYQNPKFDTLFVEKVKGELFLWLDWIEFHVNAVWDGVSQGKFNVARGREGLSVEQRQVVARFMVCFWRKLQHKNARHKEWFVRKMRKFAKYDFVVGGMSTPREGSYLDYLYGSTREFPRSEYDIAQLGDWAAINEWIVSMFHLAEKVVFHKLDSPTLWVPAENDREHYETIFGWLSLRTTSASPSSPTVQFAPY